MSALSAVAVLPTAKLPTHTDLWGLVIVSEYIMREDTCEQPGVC